MDDLPASIIVHPTRGQLHHTTPLVPVGFQHPQIWSPPPGAPGAVRVGRLPRLSFGKDNLLHGRGVGVVDLSDLQTAASHVREGGGLGTFGVLALWPSPESNDSQFGKALQRGRRFALRLHSKNVVEDGVQEASGSFVRALPREQRG